MQLFRWQLLPMLLCRWRRSVGERLATPLRTPQWSEVAPSSTTKAHYITEDVAVELWAGTDKCYRSSATRQKDIFFGTPSKTQLSSSSRGYCIILSVEPCSQFNLLCSNLKSTIWMPHVLGVGGLCSILLQPWKKKNPNNADLIWIFWIFLFFCRCQPGRGTWFCSIFKFQPSPSELRAHCSVFAQLQVVSSCQWSFSLLSSWVGQR